MLYERSINEDVGTTGWISLADVFLMSAATLFALCFSLLLVVQKQRAVITTGTERVDRLEEEKRAWSDLKGELDEVRGKKEAADRALNAQAVELQATKADALKLQAESIKLATESAGIKSMRDDLQEKLNQISLRRDTEGKLRQELIGIQGELNRVVFIFDRSGSMEGARWNDAVATAQTWLNLLPVREAALILFNDSVETYPEGRQLLEMNDPNRAALITRLRQVRPSGMTDTYAALERAFGYERIDSIILFSDGRPQLRAADAKNKEYQGQIDRIYKLVDAQASRNRRIPINIVGLGDYFEPEFGRFLMELARKTNGTFLGR